MSYGFNEDKSKFDLEEMQQQIDGKASIAHAHNAADITEGTLAVARGGTGQTSLQAFRNAAGLGNTTGALPVANGGTGATAAAGARTNIGATSRRNVTANYSGSTSGNPDFLLKSFSDGGVPSSSHTRSISIAVSGYLPIAIASARVKDHLNNAYMAFGSALSNTAVTLYFDSSVGYTVDSTIQVLYVRTALLNQ